MWRKPEIAHLRRNFVQNPGFSFFPEDQLSHRKALLRKSIPTTQQSDYPPTKMAIEVNWRRGKRNPPLRFLAVPGIHYELHGESLLRQTA